MSKRNLRRQLARHPATTCTACDQALTWDPENGCYGTDTETWGHPDRTIGCPAGGASHIPANGRRPHPMYGDPGGASR